MRWRIFLTTTAKKQFRRLPARDAQRISRAIDGMELNPFSGDVKKLTTGGEVWRRRIGNYRIIFELFLRERAIFIYEITRRTSKTY